MNNGNTPQKTAKKKWKGFLVAVIIITIILSMCVLGAVAAVIGWLVLPDFDQSRSEQTVSEKEGGNSEIIEKAKQLISKGDYPSAIKLLKSEAEKDKDAADLYNATCDDYVKKTINKANSFAALNKHDEAIKKAEEIYDTIGENYEADEAIELYTNERDQTDVVIPEQSDIVYDSHEPFYGIWVYASKNLSEAQAFANTDPDADVYVSCDWSDLNPSTWYVVSVGRYSTKTDAENALAKINDLYPDAYVKYTGNWRWNTAEPSDEPVSSEADLSDPFYGVWCISSKDQSDAEAVYNKLLEKGFKPYIVRTEDWSNLNDGWYAVTCGVYATLEEAKAQLPSVQELYSDAYVKYSGIME